MSRILIVDDEAGIRRILAAKLRQDRYELVEAGSVAEARQALAAEALDAVITDQKMGDGAGLDVLAAARESDPSLSVVFLTAHATVELAVESMRRGAFDFITKPFVPEVLAATARRAVEHTSLLRENLRLRDAVTRLEGSSEIMGTSRVIRDLREKIARVAPTNATVLISGETGTGKELVARAIHRSSPRATHALIAVNCAAFTETLLESELFGHERGAFTGADRAREGLFEAANEGTLFLDEAGEMSMPAQAKLLRVLTDGMVTRLGSTRPRKVDVRLLVATHRDLHRRVGEGLFREDLYYRLAVVPITIAPLRERPEDIAQLCEVFLVQVARELKIPLHTIGADAMRALTSYSFPGNVRELRNLIERACILSADSELSADHFPMAANAGAMTNASDRAAIAEPAALASALPDKIELRTFLAELERALLDRALRSTHGAQAEAARKLGLSRSDLSYKISKYGMRPSSE